MGFSMSYFLAIARSGFFGWVVLDYGFSGSYSLVNSVLVAICFGGYWSIFSGLLLGSILWLLWSILWCAMVANIAIYVVVVLQYIMVVLVGMLFWKII